MSFTIFFMRLTGEAYVVYQQLRGEANLDKIKCALHKSFGMDAFVVWQTVDIYQKEQLFMAILATINWPPVPT